MKRYAVFVYGTIVRSAIDRITINTCHLEMDKLSIRGFSHDFGDLFFETICGFRTA